MPATLSSPRPCIGSAELPAGAVTRVAAPTGHYSPHHGNAAIFERLWLDPKYVALHRRKDAIKPFSTPPNSAERTAALKRFDRACARIQAYETKAGVR